MSALRFVFLWLVLALPVIAGNPSSAPIQKRLGLSISLTANRYQIPQHYPGGKPLSLVASVAMTNHGREAATFTFMDGFWAGQRFMFRIIDSQGEEVWRSEAEPSSASGVADAALRPGRTWRRTLQIPLTIGGEALAPGIYTLEASLATGHTGHSGAIHASTRFEILSPWGDLDESTGIEGTVSQLLNTPAANEPVWITELREPNRSDRRPPFTATTRTDSEGKFATITPPGRYRVAAGPGSEPGTSVLVASNALANVGAGSATTEVKVAAGSFAQVNLALLILPGLPPTFPLPDRGFGVQLWQDPMSDDVIVQVLMQVPTGGYAMRLAYIGTSVDGVARLAFGVRPPTGVATQAFVTHRTLHKLARTPGLRRVEVNEVGVDLTELIPAPVTSPDTGVDIFAVFGDVPVPNARLKVKSTPTVQQAFTIGPNGEIQPLPIGPAFWWEGYSDENGQLSFDLAPGNYDLTLSWDAGSGSDAAGSYGRVVHLKAGERERVFLLKRNVPVITR